MKTLLTLLITLVTVNVTYSQSSTCDSYLFPTLTYKDNTGFAKITKPYVRSSQGISNKIIAPTDQTLSYTKTVSDNGVSYFLTYMVDVEDMFFVHAGGLVISLDNGKTIDVPYYRYVITEISKNRAQITLAFLPFNEIDDIFPKVVKGNIESIKIGIYQHKVEPIQSLQLRKGLNCLVYNSPN